MARTRRAKSSSPLSRKKSLRKEPVPDPVFEPSSGGRPLQKRPRVESSEPIDLTKQSPEPSPVPTPVPSPISSPIQPPVPSPAPQAEPQEPQPPLLEPQIPVEIALEEVRNPTLIHFTIDGRHGILGARHIAEALRIPYEPSHFDDFRAWTSHTELEMVHTLSRGAATQSHLLRGELPPIMFLFDAFLCHNLYPLQHWTQRRGVLLEALYKMSEGFFFGPHHLILAALLYFEEKVHKKKLQRVDTIPFLFPRLLCQILEHLGYPSEPQLERKRIFRELFTLDKWNNMTTYRVDQPKRPQPATRRASPRHIPEGITVAAPAIPRAPPVASASSQPSTSAEPRMAIPISKYRELCCALETLTASQSSLAQEMAAIRACQEQMLATQAQHTAILRQLWLHFDLPPAVEPSTSTTAEPHSHPPEPQAPAEAPTEEADPSA
uniref:Uncharacterized protein n=1 Tax=Vitis vinifera TaxID=29760 RepID=A5AXE1_VITVI|nr:hypothetical protein VITISV_027607 [Vitis vinifera]